MAPRTIVVVEDEAPIADAIAARLRSEGFTVELASDGLAGVELCSRVRPHLVVLDLMLPGMDGLEVCRRVQQERPVPVVSDLDVADRASLADGLACAPDEGWHGWGAANLARHRARALCVDVTPRR